MRVHSFHIILALWGFSTLALGQAQNCQLNSKSCALQNSKTTLTDSLLNLPNCNTAILEEALEPSLYPILPKDSTIVGRDRLTFDPSKARFAPVSFLRGACRFHSPTATTLPELQKTADLLQRAATVGLMPAQKSAAALFEGLTHCRAASTLQDEVDKIKTDSMSDAKDLKKMQNDARDIFCLHRSMAKEAFSEVNWVGFNLDYQKTAKGRSLDDHLKEMASCGKELLNSDYDSVCGEVTALDKESVKSLATEAANSILPNFVTVVPEESEGSVKPDAAVPPFTAMMARKLEMTRASLQQGGERFEDLSRKAQILEAAYEKVLALYGTMDGEDILTPAKGGLVGQISDLQARYLETVSEVQSLLELTNRWVKGLYTDPDKHDLRKDLLDRQAQLSAQMEFISSEGKGLLDDLTTITDSIATMAKNDGPQNNQILKSMCALYFCEIRGRNPVTFKDTCSMVLSSTTRVYDMNPLCDHPTKPANNGVLVLGDGSRKNVSDVCRSAGFDPAAFPISGHPSVNTCMKQSFDASALGVTL